MGRSANQSPLSTCLHTISSVIDLSRNEALTVRYESHFMVGVPVLRVRPAGFGSGHHFQISCVSGLFQRFARAVGTFSGLGLLRGRADNFQGGLNLLLTLYLVFAPYPDTRYG